MINLFVVGPEGLNVGNEVIAYALRRLLRQAFDQDVNLLQVPSAGAPEAGWLAGLTAASVHEMNLYGHGVVVGAGNLYENGRLAVDTHALRRLRPPLLLCGLSYGRIYDQRGRLTDRTDSLPDHAVVALNEVAVGAVVRDDATIHHHRQLGIEDAVLGACPSLLLSDVVDQPAPTKRGGTILSVRAPHLMSVPLAEQARVGPGVAAVADRLSSEGFGPVRILCHDRRDVAFASMLGPHEVVVPDDLPMYLDLLRSAELVVTFRLHAFVPSLSFGVPAINISYDERSSSLVRTLGLSEWDIDFLREPDLASAVLDRAKRLDDLVDLVDGARPTWDGLAQTLRGELARFAAASRAYAADFG